MIGDQDQEKTEKRGALAAERRKSLSIIDAAVAVDQEAVVVPGASHHGDERVATANQRVEVDREVNLHEDERAVITREDQMRGGGVVDQAAILERETGETTTPGGEGTVEIEEEEGGETGDAVEHHLIEVKGHQRGTDNQRLHPCTRGLEATLLTLSHPQRRETNVQ